MKGRLFQNLNYLGWIIIIVTFIILYLSYYLIYIPNQKADLTQRAFRILKEYGNNMVGKHAYYDTHFQNYGIYYLLESFEKEKLIVPIDSTADNYGKMHEVFRDLFDYVVIDSLQKDRIKGLFCYDHENKPLLHFDGQVPDDDAILNISKVYKFQEEKSAWTDNKTIFDSIFYKIPIERFMEGLKFDELFENITLFDRGKVFYNSNLDNLPDITTPGPLCDSTDRAQGGIYQMLNIRGKEKHVMILPIDFKGERIYIAGIINDVVYKTITQTFNTWILMIVAGILLLILVSMPILKTMFIGPRERLKAFDVSGSGVSVLFGSALFVLLIISIIKHQFVDHNQISERIDKISDTLISNISSEIESVKKLGFAIAEKDSTYSDLAQTVIDTFKSQTGFFKDDSLRNIFPLNEIILIDSSGIVKKAYTRTAFSDAVQVNLSGRQYFRNVADPKLSWVNNSNSYFFLESIKSYNTGYQETAISFSTSKYGDNKVLAITAKIPSLYNQVLPSDIQFVVIDKAGKVLFHSKTTKNLHENFIEECESNPGILNAMQLKIKDKVKIRYNETRWMACIAPITGTQLYHITLLDLNQTDNKNARIFLITFFLTIGLQVFTIGSIVLFVLAFRNKEREPDFLSFIKWLSYYQPNYNIYKGMLIVLGLIAAAGIWSFMSQADVVNVLLLQVLSVGLTFFTTLFFLNRNEFRLKDYFKINYFPENLIFVFLVLMILFGFVKSASDKTVVVPLIILLFTALIVPLIYMFFGSRNENDPKPSDKKSKRYYLLVLFLWLAIFSVIPVIHSYFSVKHFEEKLWQQQQLFRVANDNLQLLKSDKNYNSEWYRSTKGNGIDGMRIAYFADDKISLIDSMNFDSAATVSEKLYAWFPDPIENGYSHREFLAGKVQPTEWKLKDKSLFYQVEGNGGVIQVESGDKPDKPVGYFILVFFVFILAAFCIWQLVQFAARVFLNLDNIITKSSGFPWLNFLKEVTNQRILLKTFNGDLFLTETAELLENHGNNVKRIESVQAITLLQNDFSWSPYFDSTAQIIWIYGINECVPEIDKHSRLLEMLTLLNHNHNKKIVVELPFELELIDEYYNDYIATGQLNSTDGAQIFKLRNRWKVIFEEYVSYNGYLSQVEKINENENRLSSQTLKKYYQKIIPERNFMNIWKNLTNYEKIVLYDLADDGLMNRNNRKTVSQLTEKMLISFSPYPGFYLNSFREFVYQHITRSEIKTIENKLGLKGSWKNAKYLILLIIIPIAAFIFISQGISIERSFGIFAGIIGAITALMKLLEGNTFKSS